MDRVEITRKMVGICGMQVCAVKDATNEEILEVCNTQNPSGTQNGWATVVREVDEDNYAQQEQHLPVQCEDYEERLHFLIYC